MIDYRFNFTGGIGQYAKDVDSQENWNRYTAMKRYHRRFGEVNKFNVYTLDVSYE